MRDVFKPAETLDELIEDVAIPTETKPEKQHLQPLAVNNNVEEEEEDLQEQEEEEIEEPMTPKKIKSNTDFVLGMINSAQTETFRFGASYNYKRKLKRLYGDDALQVAEIVDDIANEDLTEKQKGIKKANAKIDKLFKSLPMSVEEKEMLYPVVEDWVIANHGKVPKNFFLYLGISKMIGSRLINVLSF